jgi:hypothetical protein
MKLTGENQSTRGKTCPSATFSTTNPTWTDPGSNPGLRGGRPATNRLSHGMALLLFSQTLHVSIKPIIIDVCLYENVKFKVTISQNFVFLRRILSFCINKHLMMVGLIETCGV